LPWEIPEKNLLAVAFLFLFTFFNLILDAPRRTSGTKGTPAAAGMLATQAHKQQQWWKQQQRCQDVRNSTDTNNLWVLTEIPAKLVRTAIFFEKIQRKIAKITLFCPIGFS
jgi:hypothetical protein